MYDSINNVIDNLQFDKSKVTRINAIKKDNGAYGCVLSHIEALQDAKKNGYNKVLILEDDFQPYDYEDTKFKVNKFLNEVDDWDLLMLSSNVKNYQDCGIENVKKAIDCQSTIAYAVNNHFIDKLLEVFNESANMLSQISKYQEPCEYCVDVYWKNLQNESKKWYVFVPLLGQEYPKWSDVQDRFLSHF
jgi:glycosyl transferase family 25